MSSYGCFTGSGAIGSFVNGASLSGMCDKTYKNQGVWSQNGPEFKMYDLDVCNGFVQGGEYYHDQFPPCLKDRLNDVGAAHSPIYGWVSDGYPLFGPYQRQVPSH